MTKEEIAIQTASERRRTEMEKISFIYGAVSEEARIFHTKNMYSLDSIAELLNEFCIELGFSPDAEMTKRFIRDNLK